jgi:hypothetical protein
MLLFLQIAVSVFIICFFIGLCRFIMFGIEEADKIMEECIHAADDSELDCWGW